MSRSGDIDTANHEVTAADADLAGWNLVVVDDHPLVYLLVDALSSWANEVLGNEDDPATLTWFLLVVFDRTSSNSAECVNANSSRSCSPESQPSPSSATSSKRSASTRSSSNSAGRTKPRTDVNRANDHATSGPGKVDRAKRNPSLWICDSMPLPSRCSSSRWLLSSPCGRQGATPATALTAVVGRRCGIRCWPGRNR